MRLLRDNKSFMGICELDVTIVAGVQGNGVPAWCHETVQGSAAEAAVGIPGLVLKKQLFSLLHEGGQAKGADAIVQQHFDAVPVEGIGKFLSRLVSPAGDGEGAAVVCHLFQNEGWWFLLRSRFQRGKRDLLRLVDGGAHQQCGAGAGAEGGKPEPVQPPMRSRGILRKPVLFCKKDLVLVRGLRWCIVENLKRTLLHLP